MCDTCPRHRAADAWDMFILCMIVGGVLVGAVVICGRLLGLW